MNWLFLRGLARDARHWGPFPKIFEERVPEAKVFTLDLAGMGTERRRNAPVSVKETMEDARHRWEALNADFGGPWGLLAISFGGMVALEWGSEHPYDFQRIVTINTSVSSLSPAQHRLRPGVWLDFLKIARSKSPIQKERTILGFNSNITAERDSLLEEEWSGYAATKPNPTKNSIRQILAGIGYKAPKQLSPPLLIISSLQDKLCHPTCSWNLANHLGAPVIFHDRAGHDLPLDAPEWLSDQVTTWLQQG